MAQPAKSLTGAYGMALLGLILGILGMHRYYLRRRLSATLLTVMPLASLFLVVNDLVQLRHQMLAQLTTSLSPGATSHDIPEIGNTIVGLFSANTLWIAAALYGAGVLWWLADLFLLSGMVKEYERENPS